MAGTSCVSAGFTKQQAYSVSSPISCGVGVHGQHKQHWCLCSAVCSIFHRCADQVLDTFAAAGGYGFCHVPTAPGTYELDCPTWLPEVRHAM